MNSWKPEAHRCAGNIMGVAGTEGTETWSGLLSLCQPYSAVCCCYTHSKANYNKELTYIALEDI